MLNTRGGIMASTAARIAVSLVSSVYRSCSASARVRLLYTSSACLQQSAQVVVSEDRRKLKLVCEGEQERRFHGIWLRHNCRCDVCYSHDTNMSRVSSSQLVGVRVSAAHINGDFVHVEWISPNGSTHMGCLPVSWLKENDYSLPESFERRRRETRPLVAHSLPRIEFNDMLKSDEGLFSWLKQINYYGFSVVVGVDTHTVLQKFIRSKFSHLQPTIYGEVFDVKSMKDPAVVDLGYSSEELLFHQDLLFYESPPGIELFHCVKFDECVEGGESVLLDTYPVVEEMRRRHPKQFDTLTKVPVTFQKVSYKDTGASDMKVSRHHIVLDRYGEVATVNWNPHHMDPLFVPEDCVEDYYDAYLTFDKLISDHPLKITHRLVPGEALFFNNRRILHARNAFKLNGGIRHFAGFYINIDYLRSEFQVLSKRLGKDETSKHVFNHTL